MHILIWSVGTPSVPAQIADTVYDYGCTNFNTTLRWNPPHGNYRIDYYRIRINGQSQAAVNDTSYMIESLPYSENITIEIEIVNCAGEGAVSTVFLTKGSMQIN